MHSTMHPAHWTVYMYVYCLLLSTVNAYFIWTVALIFIVTVWTFVNTDICEWTLDKICVTFDKQQTSILVLCSSTVKEPAVSSDSRV